MHFPIFYVPYNPMGSKYVYCGFHFIYGMLVHHIRSDIICSTSLRVLNDMKLIFIGFMTMILHNNYIRVK